MSAHAITDADWREAVWGHVVPVIDEAIALVDANRDLHPMGLATVRGWMDEMKEAARYGDAAEVARLDGMVRGKIAQERKWYPQA
ncbi:MAG: hypothetical protein EOS11_10300 [Mesorhizobium sp.]|nr:MAG: hypothetical protein EOS11_10300 [Mesorhizobium sp.]